MLLWRTLLRGRGLQEGAALHDWLCWPTGECAGCLDASCSCSHVHTTAASPYRHHTRHASASHQPNDRPHLVQPHALAQQCVAQQLVGAVLLEGLDHRGSLAYLHSHLGALAGHSAYPSGRARRASAAAGGERRGARGDRLRELHCGTSHAPSHAARTPACASEMPRGKPSEHVTGITQALRGAGRCSSLCSARGETDGRVWSSRRATLLCTSAEKCECVEGTSDASLARGPLIGSHRCTSSARTQIASLVALPGACACLQLLARGAGACDASPARLFLPALAPCFAAQEHCHATRREHLVDPRTSRDGARAERSHWRREAAAG